MPSDKETACTLTGAELVMPDLGGVLVFRPSPSVTVTMSEVIRLLSDCKDMIGAKEMLARLDRMIEKLNAFA